MRKSKLERLREAKLQSMAAVELDLDGLLKLLADGDRPAAERRLNPTQQRFIYSPDRIKAYMGVVGCAKTSTLCAAGFSRALLQPGSKGLVARHDYNDLLDTTMGRMQEMLSRLPHGTLLDRDKSPPAKWWIQPVPVRDPVTGAIDDRPSQITFMGLKDAMGSYDFNWAIVDEANEVAESRIHEINTRLRTPGGDYMVALAYNPPDKHHWLYTACTGKDFQDRRKAEPWITLFEPEPNENTRNLPDGYYQNLAATLPEDMRQRLIEGKWGSTFEGQPVFRQFRMALHCRRNIEFTPDAPIFRFWDFGYSRPYCCWAQLDFHGRLKVLREVLGENMEVRPFVDLCKSRQAQWFRGPFEFTDYGDPAVKQKKDTGQTLAKLAQAGIQMGFRYSKIEWGLTAIRNRLETMIEGEPQLQFDTGGVPILIAGLRGGYHLDEMGLKPVKDGFYDHPVDAFRYGIINVFGIHDGEKRAPLTGRHQQVPAVPHYLVEGEESYEPITHEVPDNE